MIALAPLLAALAALAPQDARVAAVPREPDCYRVVDLPAPDGVVLEVSGLTQLADGALLVATRRGELWRVEGAEGPPEELAFTLAMDGLQEPLGLLEHDGWIYMAQRGELSRVRDVDGDGRMDELETVCDAWRLSGNYHEYCFGPRLGPDGNFWITLNKPFGDEPFGRVDWRGWCARVTPEGEFLPTCNGLRSPCGLGVSPGGVVFYSDNQGEWCGASKLSVLEPGDFHGHPWGLPSCARAEWPYPHPGEIPDGVPMPEAARTIPRFRLPAVWFPYDEMGRSPSGFVWDTTGGRFGPFEGQLFVGDQYAATVMRVFLEQVDGEWQGACFPFRAELLSGVVRVAWGSRGALFVGTTNRGWASLGSATEGLQRIEWTGRTPFEVLEMLATPDGFELVFTGPVDPEAAGAASSYSMESYTYLLHSTYGSPEVDVEEPRVVSATVADDGLSVRLEVRPLRAGYVHELRLPGVRSKDGAPLLHPRAYYTLQRIPR